MLKVFYFAYGSNLSHERLISRVGLCAKHRNYTLRGYKLSFNCGNRGLVYANIVKGRDTDSVEGVLYELNAEQFKELDWYEGFYIKEFFMTDQQELCAVYVGHPHAIVKAKDTTKPMLAYLNVIIEGCLENNLRHTYDELIAYKEKNYKLKRGNKHRKTFEWD